MLLFYLAYAFGYRRGLRAQRARQAMTLDDAYARLDRLQDRNDRHDKETQQLRVLLLDETQRYRLQLLEVGHERDLLLGKCRAANVMANHDGISAETADFHDRSHRPPSQPDHQPSATLSFRRFNFSSGEYGRS